MQIFICPECRHKSFFDPWVESAHCPRCGFSPRPNPQTGGFGDENGKPTQVAPEGVTYLYRSTKAAPAARKYIILVRRDEYLYTFGEDAVKVIKVLGIETRVDEIFEGVAPPAARIPFEDRYAPIERVEAAGYPVGISESGILTCPRCERQNLTKNVYFASYQCLECNYIPPERDQLVQALIRKGIEATEEGDMQAARYTLEEALYHEGTPDHQAEALFWLAETTPNLFEKREYLKKALEQNPSGTLLAGSIQATLTQVENIIEGKTEAPEISKELPETFEAKTVRAERHNCPRCGSKMGFSPDEGQLVCSSCQHRQALDQPNILVQEQSFTEAMARLKGHDRAINTRSLECSACGAIFILAPATLSQTCPYCASSYTLAKEAARALIPPTGVMPFEISQTKAQKHLQIWLESKEVSISIKINPPLGVYLPFWTFDIGGMLGWLKSGLFVSQSRQQSVFFDDIMVPAVSKISPNLITKTDFNLEKLVPYSPNYLVDWPAETYGVALSDAALIARQKAIDSFRTKHRLDKNVQLRTVGLKVETFKLILIPVWIAHFDHRDIRYRVIINGQSGTVRIQKL